MEISNQFLDMQSIKPNSLDGVSQKDIKTDESLRDVCNDFESFFMNQILTTSLKSSKMAGEGTGSDIIKGMYTDALSQESSGSLGISDMLYKFLSEKKA
ncbi:MAG: rod-binding protein [Arcobacteraceae bacterium]